MGRTIGLAVVDVMPSTHKTKIVATIGPASDSPAVMERMIRAGMNVARLNFSHGTLSEHAERIERLRRAAEVVGTDIAIMADLPGLKMRIGHLETEPIDLCVGARFTLTVDSVVGNATRVSASFERLPKVVKPGDQLFLNDGLIELEVVEVIGAEVHSTVTVGGELRSHKGINLPGLELGASGFTERDRECLAFALQHGVDAVSQSFVESAADVRAVREAASVLGHQPFVIAKIERAVALDRLDEILAEADGIMVARGDLGVEVPVERIAVIQKRIIEKALGLAKPVITATQLLESMTYSRQPTRAESTDVANAILDGTDCVMLSGESAVGRFPVESVAMLARIAMATEPHRSAMDIWDELRELTPESKLRIPDLLSLSVEAVMACSNSAAVVTPTRGGTTSRSLSRCRLPVWIAAVSARSSVCRQLHFSYGVHPIHRVVVDQDWTSFAREWVRAQKLPGDLVLLVAGPSDEEPDASFRLEMISLEHGAS